jgi:hypothetical protein
MFPFPFPDGILSKKQTAAELFKNYLYLLFMFMFISIFYSISFKSLDVVALLVPVFKVVEAFQEMRDRNSNSEAL